MSRATTAIFPGDRVRVISLDRTGTAVSRVGDDPLGSAFVVRLDGPKRYEITVGDDDLKVLAFTSKVNTPRGSTLRVTADLDWVRLFIDPRCTCGSCDARADVDCEPKTEILLSAEDAEDLGTNLHNAVRFARRRRLA